VDESVEGVQEAGRKTREGRKEGNELARKGGSVRKCVSALTQILGGGGALERGHRASLERLTELGDALSSVGAFSIYDAAQRIVGQAVSMTKEECQGALTGKQTLRGSGVLERPDSVVLGQVKRKQLRVTGIEASCREVDVRLLGLDAAEGDDLRHLGDDRQDGGDAIAKRVFKQTVMGKGEVSRGIDRKVDSTGAAVHLSEVTALPLSASHSLVMPSGM
jgi:hypothetical protein